MQTDDLRNTYLNILASYNAEEEDILTCWEEVERSYADPRRAYHNFDHLIAFAKQLDLCRDSLRNYYIAFLAMIYHDVVYFMPDGTNEARSADLASKHLQQLGLPADDIARCRALIMATKNHAEDADPDINYFIDADMAILGFPDDAYKSYSDGIRQEYGDSPQFNSGRKKVLERFLAMDRIYKTELFRDRYEAKARENIRREIRLM